MLKFPLLLYLTGRLTYSIIVLHWFIVLFHIALSITVRPSGLGGLWASDYYHDVGSDFEPWPLVAHSSGGMWFRLWLGGFLRRRTSIQLQLYYNRSPGHHKS